MPDIDKREPSLPPEVRERLGKELRQHLTGTEAKPVYLGDPALSPELSDGASRLASSLRASEEGREAVEQALRLKSAPENENGPWS